MYKNWKTITKVPKSDHWGNTRTWDSKCFKSSCWKMWLNYVLTMWQVRWKDTPIRFSSNFNPGTYGFGWWISELKFAKSIHLKPLTSKLLHCEELVRNLLEAARANFSTCKERYRIYEVHNFGESTETWNMITIKQSHCLPEESWINFRTMIQMTWK